MNTDLPLIYPTGIFSNNDGIDKNKTALQEIVSFKERLEYYNKNICSLAFRGWQTLNYRTTVHDNDRIMLFCRCKKCKGKELVNDKDEQIFLALKIKEVNKVKALIEKQSTYKKKLEAAMKVKGFSFQSPLIYIEDDTDKNTDDNPEIFINLRPELKDEIVIFNNLFRQVKTANDDYPIEYIGFRFEVQKKLFLVRWQNAGKKEGLAPMRMSEIEVLFDFDRQETSNSTFIENLKNGQFGIEKEVFRDLMNGVDFEEIINREQLDNLSSFNKLIHIYNIFQFYKFLEEFIRKNENDHNKPTSHEHERLKPTFNHKLNDGNIKELVSLINKIKIFQKETNFEELKAVFDCKTTVPIKVINNQNLSIVFSNLCTGKFICENWKSVIEQNKLFLGNSSRNIELTAANLANTYPSKTSDTYKTIVGIINQLV